MEKKRLYFLILGTIVLVAVISAFFIFLKRAKKVAIQNSGVPAEIKEAPASSQASVEREAPLGNAPLLE